jgi:glutamate synthase (ferredoxin)
VAFYGAISGKAYINGISGARFCVRNSGIEAVVEGVGDHGCEYMTGGCVLVLGKTGRNFAAGMSGGVAYVYNEDGSIFNNCNRELVIIEEADNEDKKKIKLMLEEHFKYTASEKAKRLLGDFKTEADKFIKIIPQEYKKIKLQADKTGGENNG